MNSSQTFKNTVAVGNIVPRENTPRVIAKACSH